MRRSFHGARESHGVNCGGEHIENAVIRRPGVALSGRVPE